METTALNARLMEEARRYDPKERPASKLTPHRNALILLRAKGMSYARIAARFRQQGLPVAPSTVVEFCTQHIKETEILRERRRLEADGSRPQPTAAAPVVPFSVPAAGAVAPGRRGPRIARDDF